MPPFNGHFVDCFNHVRESLSEEKKIIHWLGFIFIRFYSKAHTVGLMTNVLIRWSIITLSRAHASKANTSIQYLYDFPYFSLQKKNQISRSSSPLLIPKIVYNNWVNFPSINSFNYLYVRTHTWLNHSLKTQVNESTWGFIDFSCTQHTTPQEKLKKPKDIHNTNKQFCLDLRYHKI